MKKTQFALSTILPAMALITALSFTSPQAFAQSSNDSMQNPTSQQQPMQPDDQNATSVKTFSGKIMKSGDKLVLMDTASKTTYQLDDQQKAQDFLNKTVKVTGTLEASTGTIRVTAIEPV
jgi:hypothetical protein